MTEITQIETLIRERLKVLDISIHAFCKKCGIPRSTLYRVFKAEGHYSLHTVKRIAKELGCKFIIILEAIDGK